MTDGPLPDNASEWVDDRDREEESSVSTTGGGAIGGAISGAALSQLLGFRLGGLVTGILLGALVGDELEKREERGTRE